MQHPNAETLTALKICIILQVYSDASGKHKICTDWKREKTHNAFLFTMEV